MYNDFIIIHFNKISIKRGKTKAYVTNHQKGFGGVIKKTNADNITSKNHSE